MNNISFEDIKRYLSTDRASHEHGQDRAAAVATYLQTQLNCQHIEVLVRGMKQPGWDTGSCLKFNLFFDKNWLPLQARLDDPHVRYGLQIALSERGPFVTSSGIEWYQAEQGQLPKIQTKSCAVADDKAMAIAKSVAVKFDLSYLDRDWLSRIELDPKCLSDDAMTSLDYSEPTALNILFDELT